MSARFAYVIGGASFGSPLLTAEESETLTDAVEEDLDEIHYGMAAIGTAIHFLDADECGEEVIQALGSLTTYLGKLGAAVSGAAAHARPKYQAMLQESRADQVRAARRKGAVLGSVAAS